MHKAEVIELISKYYPAGISNFDEAYDHSVQHKRLIESLEKEYNNTEWIQWVNKLRSNPEWVVLNLSTYSFASPCHRVNVSYFSDQGRFEIKLYISIISPFFLIKVNELKLTSHGNRLKATGNHIIDLDSPALAYFVSNTTDVNPAVLPQLNKLVILLKQLPSLKIFLPPLLIDEIVPARCTNSKKIGAATIFDFLFDDLER